MKGATLLLVEPDSDFRTKVKNFVESSGLYVCETRGGREAEVLLRSEEFDLILLALRLPDGNGLEWLPKLSAVRPRTPVIVMTSYYSIQSAVEAMKAGAFDYLPKPFPAEQLLLVLRKALQSGALQTEMSRLHEENLRRHGPDAFVGNSRVVRELREEVRKIAASPANTILILGESGTGKDVMAKAIHYSSPQADKPFIPINCSAIPENLLESELFGHERGAFTDAKYTKKGQFELANEGTAFLDEVGELGLALQAKLLRFLEERAFRRVGGTRNIQPDLRIIAATNMNLERAVAQGRFREDLYYRLSVVPLFLPPLRERKEDVALLARHFMDFFNKKFRKRFESFTPEAIRKLTDYSWPGNVRELKNVIERAMLLEKGPVLEVKMLLLPEEIRPQERAASLAAPPQADLSLSRLELEALVKALSLAEGNQSRAAHLLGVSRETVRTKMRRYGIKMEAKASGFPSHF